MSNDSINNQLHLSRCMLTQQIANKQQQKQQQLLTQKVREADTFKGIWLSYEEQEQVVHHDKGYGESFPKCNWICHNGPSSRPTELTRFAAILLQTYSHLFVPPVVWCLCARTATKPLPLILSKVSSRTSGTRKLMENWLTRIQLEVDC